MEIGDEIVATGHIAELFLDIEKDDGISIEMRFVTRIASNVEVGEEIARVAGAIVIGRDHLCGEGFSESTRSRDAQETLSGIDIGV